MTAVNETKSRLKQALGLARSVGILRPRDLRQHGIPVEYLSRLARRGEIQRIGRGLYECESAEITEHHSLVEASKRIPRGVICLLSALHFHNLTTQMPFQVWIALDRKAWEPGDAGLPIRVVRFSGAALTEGVESHRIEGTVVRVYSVAKTVVDCFKFRNKIGLDVALEALREGRRARRFTMDEIWRYAQVCRVTNVMRPYLESVV